MDPRRVIRSYLVISGLFTLSASLIWGINTLFLLHAGLNIFEVFLANAAFTAAMALFEVPTGVVADTLGRRTSFLLSEATLAVGTLAYVGVAAIHGGLLGQLTLSLTYVARAVLVTIAFSIGFRTMHEIGFTPRALHVRGVVGEMRKVGRAGITYGWRAPAVRLLVIESFVVWGFFSWAWYAWQPYFLQLYGHNAVWLSGLIASLFALAGIAGNALV